MVKITLRQHRFTVKFTAIPTVEEWLLLNRIKSKHNGNGRKGMTALDVSWSNKTSPLFFLEEGEGRSLWEETWFLLLLHGTWRGNHFCWNSKNFLLFDVPAFSTSYLQNRQQASNRNISLRHHFHVLPCPAQCTKAHNDLKDPTQILALSPTPPHQPTPHELHITATLHYSHKNSV